MLGVFLLRVARDPLRHRSLIWFMVWSSVAHGALMAWQTMTDPAELGHLLGDVPALFVGAFVLGLLMPSGPEADGQLERAAQAGSAQRPA